MTPRAPGTSARVGKISKVSVSSVLVLTSDVDDLSALTAGRGDIEVVHV